jgi:hypothetical protein
MARRSQRECYTYWHEPEAVPAVSDTVTENLPDFITGRHDEPSQPPRRDATTVERSRRYRERQAAKKAEARTRGDRCDITPLGKDASGVEMEAFRPVDAPKDTLKIVAPVPNIPDADEPVPHLDIDPAGPEAAPSAPLGVLAEPTRSAAVDISRPPKRLPIRIKSRWLEVKPEFREDIILREQEFDQAFKRYDGLGIYVIQAEKNGTTLAAAMKDYSAIETEFRKDLIGGALFAWRRMGADPDLVVGEILRRLGAVLPAPQQAQEAPRTGPDPLVEAAKAEGRLEHEIEVAKANPYNLYLDDFLNDGTIAAMRAANPTLSVQDAYNAAITAKGYAMPINRPDQPRRPTTPVDRARAAAKATIGAPSSAVPHDPNARRNDARTLEEVVNDAMNKQGG